MEYAQDIIIQNEGKVMEKEVMIVRQQPVAFPMEDAFQGVAFHKRLNMSDPGWNLSGSWMMDKDKSAIFSNKAGPVIAGAVKQFWTDVVWKDVDFLFVDMPPGTGDVPLTVFQSLPVDGIVVVASPQELVSMIVAKAVNMAEMMKVPMLGIVENMSYIVCPDCGKHINVFGESHVDEVAAKHGLPVLAKCPIDPQLAALSDAGMIETYGGEYLEGAADACEKLLKK